MDKRGDRREGNRLLSTILENARVDCLRARLGLGAPLCAPPSAWAA